MDPESEILEVDKMEITSYTAKIEEEVYIALLKIKGILRKAGYKATINDIIQGSILMTAKREIHINDVLFFKRPKIKKND